MQEEEEAKGNPTTRRIIEITRGVLDAAIQRMNPRQYWHYLEICATYGTPESEMPALTPQQFQIKQQFLFRLKQQTQQTFFPLFG